jgi:hypothetical protein
MSILDDQSENEPGPYLAMFDKDGVGLLHISIDGDYPQVWMSDGDEHIDISVNGCARIVFYDQDNKPMLEVRPKP